mgnify:CR=1 FL=1
MSEERKTDARRVAYRKDMSMESGPGANHKEGSLGKMLLIIVVAAVLLGAGVFLGIMLGKRDSGEEKGTEETLSDETQEEDTSEAVPESQSGVMDTPLLENAYPEINELIGRYYQAAAVGDIETINSLRDFSEQTELLQIQEKSKYLEGYEDINCYTKPGPEEDSFVVYVTYYAKFSEVEQRVCGLNTYVVCRNENGYYIHDCTGDEAMREYRTSVTKQDDVVDLFNRVQVEYNETVTGNEELAAFLTELSDNLKTAVGDALVDAQMETPEESVDEQPEAGESAASPSSVRSIDVVNIRKSDSETADILGKAQIGDEFALLEDKANGWSKIRYNDQEAYIKSEFLEAVAEEAPEAQDEQTSEENSDEGAGTTAPAEPVSNEGTTVPNSGVYRLTESVNVRRSASEAADRVGVGFPGDEVEILMKQADGWTKVKFNGETGYIKTEVLQ